MQNLEEEKNRVIEEAFIRAESEMKAVHENLAGQTSCSLHCGWLRRVFACWAELSRCVVIGAAGVRLNLLSLQPALRTLTLDYNLLKRQVQDFPFMLDQAITQAKQEVSERVQLLLCCFPPEPDASSSASSSSSRGTF